MFNGRHRKELAHFLKLHGFNVVDNGVYVRIFNTRIGQVILEFQIQGDVEFITKSAQRSRTEKFNWSRRHRDLLRVIIDTEVQSYASAELTNRMENNFGTLI